MGTEKGPEFIEKIQRALPDMSRSQRRISRFLLEEYEKAAFMTAAKLAEQTNVSESTVVRFAAALGYAGYPALQRELQQAVRHRMKPLQRMETEAPGSSGDIMRSVMRAEEKNIRRTMENMDETDFNRMAEAICAANSIYIMGLRASAPVAQFLGYYLQFLFPAVNIVTSGIHDTLEQLVHIRAGDLLIGIGFPRYSRRTVEGLRFAAGKGARVACITDSPHSPLAEAAELRLFARCDISSFADSLVAPMALADALLAAVGWRNPEKTRESLEELETLWTSYNIYSAKDNG
ncbi:MAG: MurR/RpiR family transcriptional regulator [Christensenellales bacterium]|jgi:DNA-binding MurR/RpiR family transcriptional regulator